MTKKPTPGPCVAAGGRCLAEIIDPRNTAAAAERLTVGPEAIIRLEAAGYRGAAAIKALPDVMGVLHAVANSPSSSEVGLARATARSLVHRLTRKETPDEG